MERKGYPDGFDGKTMNTEADEKIIKLGKARQELDDKKNKFKVNILEFIVGAILLFFCFQYLQQHPAEKVALLSGFEVIAQKVRVFFAEKSEGLETKYNLERSFDEVIALAKDGSCLESIQLQEIENRLTTLKDMDAETFESQQTAFINYLREQYLYVKKSCENK